MANTLAPAGEIPIEFTSLRAGEKKTEQLWSAEEIAAEASADGLLRVEPRLLSRSLLAVSLEQLKESIGRRDPAGAISLLCDLVPDFKPSAKVLTYRVSEESPVHYE